MMMFRKIRLLLSLGVLSGAVWAGAYAQFTDGTTATSTFSTGTVDLELSNDADDAYSFVTLSTANMKPGAVTYAPLTVENAGSLAFTYTMVTSDDGSILADQLTLGIRKVTATCDATNYDAATDGDIRYAEGALSAGALASRALASTGSEILCFKVLLPSATDDAFQNLSTTVTFTFSATQS